MAKNTAEAEVLITMNGKAAENALASLRKQQEQCNDAIRAGIEAQKELDKLKSTSIGDYQKVEGRSYVQQMKHLEGIIKKGKEGQTTLNRLKKEINVTELATKKYAEVLKNINGSSLAELQAVAKQLKFEIRQLPPDTQKFIDKTKQLQEVNTRIKQITGSFAGLVQEQKRSSLSLRGLVDGFNHYWGFITMAAGAVTGISTSFKKAAQAAAELDDAYADVMKTTGLLHEEVADLDKELMKIDTRTSREQLLLLARDAGKLGIQGKENILGFVRAADQIQVALGEDLGEGAIRNLGKIADVLGYTQSMGIEKSLLSIASAVNAVGQASTASEGYLVDFTQRMAGVAAQTGISAANIIGFASGLDQSAMKVEMASTAFQKFLMKLYEDPAKFAAYANLEVGKFTELLKTDANQAVITILKALKDQDGFAALVPIFKDMGLDGARAVSVLAAMATNINAVTEAQALANDEFEKATSVTEEYNTKNNNLQAQLEKARKEFHNASVELGQSLNPIMLKSTKLTTYLVKALATYGKEVRNAAIAVAVITLAIKRQAIAQTGLNVVQKIGNTLRATGNTIIWAARTAFFRLIGATEAATIAQSQLNAVMSASVFGVIALAVAGVTAAITHFVKKSREAVEVTDLLAEADKKANEEYGEQAGKVQALTAIVENNNISLAERKKALDELKKIVPGYHGDLTEEGRLINSNKEAIDEYCKSLREKIRLEARKDQLLEIEKQIAALEDQKANAQERQLQALVESGGDTTEKAWGKHSWFTGKLEFTPYGQAMADEADIDKQIAELEGQANKISDRIGKIFTDPIDKAINEVEVKYKELFAEIENEYIGRPAEGAKRMGELQEQKDKEIAAIRQKYAKKRTVETEETATTNAVLTQAQFDYLQERQDKLTKKEKEMVGKGYAALSAEESKALKTRYDKLMKADNKAADKRYQQAVKDLEKQRKAEENIATRQYLQGDLTYRQYEKRKRQIQKSFLKERLILAKQEGKDTADIEAQLLAMRTDKMKRGYEDAVKEADQSLAAEQNALKRHLKAQEITQDEYDTRMLEARIAYLKRKLELADEYGQDETAIMEAYQQAIKESQDLAFEQLEKLKEKAKGITDELHPKEARAEKERKELEELQDLYELKLITEKDFQKKKNEIIKRYGKENLDEDLANIEKYASTANSIMEKASNFVTALKEAESAKLEAEYQAQLTAAGDNAEQREQIEADYEQKKLDLQKKYADVDMAINIAKTTANGAAAIVKALVEPGGVAGTILAATIGATTAAEIATIVAQRNAIKNTSVSSSGSSSSVETGTRTVTGYSEGGFTDNAASDHKVVGVVHANEYVAPAWMVRSNPVTFANLERYRKAGSHGRTGSVSRGFADGGFTGSSAGSGTMSVLSRPERSNGGDIGTVVRVAVREELQELWPYIRVVLVRRDLSELDDLDDRLKKQTSR